MKPGPEWTGEISGKGCFKMMRSVCMGSVQVEEKSVYSSYTLSDNLQLGTSLVLCRMLYRHSSNPRLYNIFYTYRFRDRLLINPSINNMVRKIGIVGALIVVLYVLY